MNFPWEVVEPGIANWFSGCDERGIWWAKRKCLRCGEVSGKLFGNMGAGCGNSPCSTPHSDLAIQTYQPAILKRKGQRLDPRCKKGWTWTVIKATYVSPYCGPCAEQIRLYVHTSIRSRNLPKDNVDLLRSLVRSSHLAYKRTKAILEYKAKKAERQAKLEKFIETIRGDYAQA